ncbi:hypothetical protein DOTSEDRAFT_54085 [Dothistroma septosporum NZE10]|uniref:Uncharacterized protein n=1 Tax=Dothistroma septosporum (strain NZE10 / CBS 128990) TaxID=675120 RepID=M2Y4H6_DOTSN|nr:hypothetical protein DOTSEDRAFT_54085 [Dothistroma septosporum NZE10]
MATLNACEIVAALNAQRRQANALLLHRQHTLRRSRFPAIATRSKPGASLDLVAQLCSTRRSDSVSNLQPVAFHDRVAGIDEIVGIRYPHP